MDNDTNDGMGNWGFLAIPLALMIIFCLWAAYHLAKAGCKFRAIQLFIAPAWFLISNFIAIIVIIPASFIYMLFTGKSHVTQWIWNHLLDLTAFPIWGRIIAFFFRMDVKSSVFALDIPVGAVLTFQLIVFLSLGYRLSRHFTCSLIDMATAVNAANAGIDPFAARQARMKTDGAYASAANHYAKSGKPPMMGLFGVAMIGTPPDQLYRFVRS